MENPDDVIGVVLDGKYRIDQLLGRGGMGSVYAACHVQLDRTVAVKILKPELVADHEAAARFAREARASARLGHPNAVHVYDYGTSEGHTYLVMELVDGESLRALLKSAGALDPGLILEIVRQAAAALTAAHAEGVVHRDVKPENMIVRFDDAGAVHVKVVDFGLAKLLVSTDSTELTGPATLLGTPKYMAPELFTGEAVDERVDVYALGIVLYEMAVGRAPFDGTFSEVVGKHLHMEPPSVVGLRPDLPADFERVLRRAVAKSPSDRTPSAEALARELEAALGSLAGRPLARPVAAPALGNVTQPAPANFLDTPSSIEPAVPIPSLHEASQPPVGTNTMLTTDTEETRVRRQARAASAAPLVISVPGVAAQATGEGASPERESNRIPSNTKRIAAVAAITLVAVAASLVWALGGGPIASPSSDTPLVARPDVNADAVGTTDATATDSSRRATDGDKRPAPVASEPGRRLSEEEINKLDERAREAYKKAEERRREEAKKREERRRDGGKKRGERGRNKGKRE